LLLDGRLVEQGMQSAIDAVVGDWVLNRGTVRDAATKHSPYEGIELVSQVRILIAWVHLADVAA